MSVSVTVTSRGGGGGGGGGAVLALCSFAVPGGRDMSVRLRWGLGYLFQR